MENNYSVAISCHSDLGYIEYTADTKSANIVLANEVAKQKVEEFLNTPLTLQVPHETLHDFTTITINPLDDVETLQDMTVQALNDALGQIDDATKKSMGAFAGILPF